MQTGFQNFGFRTPKIAIIINNAYNIYMPEREEIAKNAKMKSHNPLPTGQVLAVLGLKYRTLYNYLHDFGDYFSEGAKKPKKGKRWTSEDISTIQTIRHLHSERKGSEEIRQSLAEGFRSPLEGAYKPEDMNRLIQAAWLLVGQAQELSEKMELQYQRVMASELIARNRVNTFLETILKYEEFEHELRQIKLIVGKISDSHKARQERDEEYQRLHKWIRFHFLAEEDRRKKLEEESLEEREDRKIIHNWVKSKFQIRKSRKEQK